MENTKIQWCNSTFNGWRGCQHALLPDGTPHPGCVNCYAEAGSKRNPKTLGTWGDDGTRVRGVDAYWQLPLKWNAEAEKAGERVRVFALSFGDVFEDWQGPITDTQRHKGFMDAEGRLH
jgi:protein gp37